MSQRSEQLVKEAELLMQFYDDAPAQRARLKTIEQQLRTEGVYLPLLHGRISAICSESDPAAFRCSYRPN